MKAKAAFRTFAERVDQAAGTPWTFLTALAIIAGWFCSGPFLAFSTQWQLVINSFTTIITFLMVFIIQNTQEHDFKALQLKLDALLNAAGQSRLVSLQDLSDDDDAIRPLAEYLARFPGEDMAIARDYQAFKDHGSTASADAEPAADRLGPYRILRQIGRGGQGTVYLAEDTALGRNVALKVLDTGVTANPEALARVRREAAITSKLDNPGICPVYATGEDRGSFWIAMRYVEGESLAARIGMLFHFAQKKGWLKQDPRLTYRPPKEALHDPNPMNDDEIAAFFDFVRKPARYRPGGWSYAEWIGIGFLSLGLRAIELMHARWEDLNWDERFLYIRKSHPNKEPQALQNQPIPTAAWPQFVGRRRKEGYIWLGQHGAQLTPDSLGAMRDTLSRAMKGFQWKRFRKSFATILMTNGVEGMTVSRLLRHSAGGKNTSIAAKHYVGRSDRYLRDVVDEAFAPYAAIVTADVGAGAALRAVEAANAMG